MGARLDCLTRKEDHGSREPSVIHTHTQTDDVSVSGLCCVWHYDCHTEEVICSAKRLLHAFTVCEYYSLS